ncbi:MAG: hypothetical protein QX198_07985 [Methylococcaceae bacterium]
MAAKYYFCGAGTPLYTQKPSQAWTIRHKLNPEATYADYTKAVSECDYQADLATYDPGRPNPARVYIPTHDYSFNNAQLDANRTDRNNEEYRQTKISFMRSKVYHHCVDATGFLITSTANKKDFDYIEKYCPDIDNYVQACFIPGAPK